MRTRWCCQSFLVLFCLATVGLALEVEPVTLMQARNETPEESLLDVGIEIFHPGYSEDDTSLDVLALEEKGVFPEVRKSEARFIPFHLKNTLQSTGYWGAVRLLPAGADTVDVAVSGQILESSGKEMALGVEVVDAAGRLWLKKRYKGKANPLVYRDAEIEAADPYQDLYNRIANDMLAARQTLTAEEIRTIRTITELKFAADLAPAVYEGYFSVNKKGHYSIERLPAEDDPMMTRISRIRERDYMFVDILNEYYADFYLQMEESYDDWRRFSYEEQVALQELRRSARMRKILGALAIFGAVVSEGNSRTSSSARNAAIIAGSAAIKSGFEQSKEAKMHVEALRELGASFDAEIAPLLVDVEGQTLRLTGSAETQYATWRQLLRQLLAAETGLPLDPNTTARLAED